MSRCFPARFLLSFCTLAALNGNTIAGGGGSFTINPNGTFTFTPGSDFADLATPGQSTRVVVDFTLHGVNTATSATRDFSGQLVIDLTRQPDNSLRQSP